MSLWKINLAMLESHLQNLIEGSAARLFASAPLPSNLAAHLVQALQDGIRLDEQGEPAAPNLYTLLVCPEQCQALQADPVVQDELTRILQEAGVEYGVRFTSDPVVRIAHSPELLPGELRILATNSQESLAPTDMIELSGEREDDQESLPEAFLIINGTQVFPLGQTVINIGRRPDNQIVITDRRVSRLHAQVRAVKGHFMIFDLDSSGGTWINGERVRQRILHPGDVISLAGVPLVFGQEPVDLGSTQERVL